MSATVVREKRQVTLPGDVFRAAGLKINDQVDWRFEDGEIHGRRMVPEQVEVLDVDDVDPVTLFPKNRRVSIESVLDAIRKDREER